MTDNRQFRRALGVFPTGVAVITAKGSDGAFVGMTMSSFNSVSLDPPLVLFSVDRGALSLPAMRAAGGYAVNVLGQHQKELSQRFARANSDKWAAVEHRLGHADAPLLDGAIAHFECAPYAVHEAGDHVVFIVRVVRYAATDEAPLVFHAGAYRELVQPAAAL